MIKSITKMGCFVLFLLLALGSIGLPVFAQQNIRLSGKVTNKKGEALQGVTVRIKGKSQGTSTDATGKYQLDVASSSTVVFSQVGMKEQERAVGNQRQLDVTLEDSDNALDEIVVTGYGGVAKKRDLTGAISSVNAKKIEERQPINLFDALQGQAAGVLIVNDGGGAPGATGSIQVRGTSTLNGGNGPLYLVDGVINPDGATINPTDIENIEVLKDAASASIYGSRAANGVILITTKRGSEGRPMVNVNYNHLFGRLAHYIPVSNSAEVRAFRYIQGLNTNTDSINPSFNSDNDLQRILLGNLAQKKEIKMSVSGGQKNLRYYSSLNYLDDKSIILNSYAKRLQSRINVEYQFSSKLRYSNNISFSWQKGNTIPIGNTIRVVMDRPAYSLIYYPDGSLTSYIGSKRNPVANALFEKNMDETYSGQFNNQLDYQIRDDLKFTTLFNVRLDNLQNTQFSPRFLSANKDQNSGTNEFNKTFTWEFQSYLNYNKTFAQDHNVTALLGFSSDRRRYDRFHSEYMNSVNEEVLVTFPDYLTPSKTYTTATANASASVFSRIGYNYKGRYLVQGSYRRDGSSRFGAANKWGNFLSASAAWRFSDENFMKWAKPALVDAKLRYSIGQLGNDKVGDYESYTKVAFGGSYNGVGGAALTSTFGNNRIKWETTTQNNVGLDLTFLNGRLGFTADYYVKTTTDLLYPRELAKETGYAKVNVNLGTIRNRGMEFVISGKPIVTPDFSWEVNGNISFERGKIVKLADGIPFFPGNKWYAEEGGRIGNFYGWRNLGVYAWDESNAYNDNWDKLTLVLDDQGRPMYRDGKAVYTFNGSDYQGTVHQLYAPDGKLKGGDAEWLNNKKDSLINDEDRMILGNATPNFYFGFMQTFRYKRFTLNVLFNGSFGGEVYNALLQRQNYPTNTGAGSPDMVYNVWRKPGDVAKYPNYVERNNRGNLKTNQNSLYIEDATFVRLSSARLAYTFDPQLINRLKMKGLTAFVYGSNLLTWTNYRGYDPEFSTNNPLTPGEDDGRYPRRREFGFGVNINF
ncbi:TonB-dependent receptor [Sphingobacterium sp. UME9]|uniref:SusC/RagA family TonB-linked outer membrane protein n=1 Tax=Sphingobacterium sp. UME9 TaxID=1862316 RepID=UPI0016044D10|nr:TonB-dependent receptor [Sphingobacterium sp. UME9]MBB1646483.1 SusC/RagA family TonB-linked outer membrane protein [Sphingobacterium sp. UME9]